MANNSILDPLKNDVLTHVVEETIRFFPPFPIGESRETTTELFLSHFYVPKGTAVVLFGLGFKIDAMEYFTTEVVSRVVVKLVSRYHILLPENFVMKYKKSTLCLELETAPFLLKERN